jgi:hypothetical protein
MINTLIIQKISRMISIPFLRIFFLLSFIIYSLAHEECGFEKYKLKNFYEYEEEEKSLRFLQTQPYESIRIVIDYTTLDKQSSISSDLKSNVKEVVERAKSVIESLIKIQRLSRKLTVTKCNQYISIADEIKSLGVNADLIIFPYVDTEMQGTTQAYASTCVISTRNSRPIAGFMGFTKNLNNLKTNWLDYYTNIAVHELTHVLGFNSDIFEAFVDENNNRISLEKTIQEITVDGVKKKMIISPKALEAARKHFNCPDLQGIELENQGGQGTMGSHWESRIMLTEYMVGFTYDEATLSEITLAFLEDTGWYKTNYYTGGLFRFGKNAGCSFINNKCIVNEKVVFKNEFCYDKNAPFCTAGRLNKGFCYINNYSSNIDPAYQYFKEQNEGGLTFTDYCPVSGVPTNKDSYLPWSCSNGIKDKFPREYEESISSNSGCFMSSLINKQHESQFIIATKAICHEYECNYEVNKYNVTIGNNVFECPSKGGYVEVEEYSGVFECPPFNLICTSEIRCNGLADCVMKKSVPVEYKVDNTDTNNDTPVMPNDNIPDDDNKSVDEPTSSLYICLNKFLFYGILSFFLLN